MPAKKPYLCRHCGETNPQNFFQQNKMKSCCMKCHTMHVHQSKRLIKLKAIEHLGGKCNRCGYKSCAAVYDFHHKDPTKKDFEWGKYRTSWERLKTELEKCMLLCANCHREVHDEIWFNSLPEAHPEILRRIQNNAIDKLD